MWLWIQFQQHCCLVLCFLYFEDFGWVLPWSEYSADSRVIPWDSCHYTAKQDLLQPVRIYKSSWSILGSQPSTCNSNSFSYSSTAENRMNILRFSLVNIIVFRLQSSAPFGGLVLFGFFILCNGLFSYVYVGNGKSQTVLSLLKRQ